MKRLTEKRKGIVLFPCDTETQRNINEKLSKLEDIEQELGIDLITLFKALKNGIWVKRTRYDYQKLHCFVDFTIDIFEKGNMKSIYFDLNYDCEYAYYKLTDYGKTWALTKEELEK